MTQLNLMQNDPEYHVGPCPAPTIAQRDRVKKMVRVTKANHLSDDRPREPRYVNPDHVSVPVLVLGRIPSGTVVSVWDDVMDSYGLYHRALLHRDVFHELNWYSLATGEHLGKAEL